MAALAAKAWSKAVRILFLLFIVLAALAIIGSYPGIKGYHYGCNVWEEPQITTTWLGLQFCKAPTAEEGAQQARGNALPARPGTPEEAERPKREDERRAEEAQAHEFDERQSREAKEQAAREPRELAKSEGR